MAVAYGAVGAAVYSAANPAPAYPTGGTASRKYLYLLYIATSPDTAPADQALLEAAGWTFQGAFSGGSGASGNATGARRVGLYSRESTTVLSGTQTVTVAGNSVTGAWIERWECLTTENFDIALTGGADSTSGTPYSVVTSSVAADFVKTGDMISVVSITPQATNPTWATPTLTAQGGGTITLGTVTVRTTVTTATGNDLGGRTITAAPTVTSQLAGTLTFSSAVSGTTTTVYGPSAIIRLRAVAPQALTGTGGLSGAGTLTTTGAGPKPTQSVNVSGSGSLSTSGALPAVTRSAGLSGTGALTVPTQIPTPIQTRGLSGAGTLSVAGGRVFEFDEIIWSQPTDPDPALDPLWNSDGQPAFYNGRINLVDDTYDIGYVDLRGLVSPVGAGGELVFQYHRDDPNATVGIQMWNGDGDFYLNFYGTGVGGKYGDWTDSQLGTGDVTTAIPQSGWLKLYHVQMFVFVDVSADRNTWTNVFQSSSQAELTQPRSLRVTGGGQTGSYVWVDNFNVAAYQVSAQLSGTGSLGASAIPTLVRSAGLSGTGTLSGQGAPKPVASSGLSGAGSLTASVVPRPIQGAALTGTGTLGSSGIPQFVMVANNRLANGSFEDEVEGDPWQVPSWGPAPGTAAIAIERVGSFALIGDVVHGENKLRVRVLEDGPVSIRSLAPVSVTAGQSWSIRAWSRFLDVAFGTGAGAGQSGVLLWFRDANGNLLSNPGSVVSGGTGWQSSTLSGWVVPAGATTMRVGLLVDNAVAGEIYEFDAVSLAPTSEFTGAVPGLVGSGSLSAAGGVLAGGDLGALSGFGQLSWDRIVDLQDIFWDTDVPDPDPQWDPNGEPGLFYNGRINLSEGSAWNYGAVDYRDLISTKDGQLVFEYNKGADSYLDVYLADPGWDYYLYVWLEPGGGAWEHYDFTGSSSVDVTGTLDIPPPLHGWIRIEQAGDTTIFSISDDQVSWVEVAALPSAPSTGPGPRQLEIAGGVGIVWVDNFVGSERLGNPAQLSGSGSLGSGGSIPTPVQSAVLSGDGSLGAGGTPQVAGTSGLAGAGSLSQAGSPGVQRSAALSGAGGLAAQGQAGTSGQASMSGSGSLGAQGIPTLVRSAGLSGSGSLSVGGKLGAAGAVGLSGAGSLTVGTRVPTMVVGAQLAGAGALATSASVPRVSGVGALAGVGSLVALTFGQGAGTAQLQGSGSLSGSAVPTAVQSAQFSGQGSLARVGVATPAQQVQLGGSGALEGAGVPAVGRLTSLSGSGSLSSLARVGVGLDAQFNGSGQLGATGSAQRLGEVSLGGSGELTVGGVPGFQGQMVAFSGGGLFGIGEPMVGLGLPFGGSGQLSTIGLAELVQIGELQGQGMLAAAGIAFQRDNLGQAELTSQAWLSAGAGPFMWTKIEVTPGDVSIVIQRGSGTMVYVTGSAAVERARGHATVVFAPGSASVE